MGGYKNLKAVTNTATATVSAGPGRLMGVYIMSGATAGSVVYRDGGASGATLLNIATPASATVPIWIDLPGDGIKFNTDIHVTIAVATSVITVFD